MSTPDWLSSGYPHIWLPYTQMKTTPPPLAARETQGVRIILEDGRELIDGVASWWTSVHGYNHPHILDAVEAQLKKMPHVMLGGLAHEQAYRLAARLAALAPGDLNRVFFSESGSVSVEIAMKMALQYWMNKGETRRSKFVSFKGGYHGDTLATMSVCDPEEGMHSLFAGGLLPQYVIDLPSTEEKAAGLDALLTEKDDVAAIITEPLIQGAGGMLVHDGETLRHMRRLADKHGVLLIFDEIFTGLGRTGDMFASVKADVAPDIMTLSKALTGGVTPLAATIASDKIFEAFYDDDPLKCFMHGPTYMGNALGCAAANASLDLFERESRLEQVRRIETFLKDALAPVKDIAGVKDVRVLGAMGAIEIREMRDVDAIKARFVERGVFVRPFNSIIYTTPAYTMPEEDLAVLTKTMLDVTVEFFG